MRHSRLSRQLFSMGRGAPPWRDPFLTFANAIFRPRRGGTKVKSAPSSPRAFLAAHLLRRASSSPRKSQLRRAFSYPFIPGHAAVSRASPFALLRSQSRAAKRFAKINLGRESPQALSRWSETFDAFRAASEKRSMFSTTVWFAVSVAFTVLSTDLSHAS